MTCDVRHGSLMAWIFSDVPGTIDAPFESRAAASRPASRPMITPKKRDKWPTLIHAPRRPAIVHARQC